jgi:predicted nuclease with TOPRIM domain
MSANPDEQHQRQIQARIDACQNELHHLEGEQQRLADRYSTLRARIDALREELQPSHCQAEPFDQWSADAALAEKRGGRP